MVLLFVWLCPFLWEYWINTSGYSSDVIVTGVIKRAWLDNLTDKDIHKAPQKCVSFLLAAPHRDISHPQANF